MTFTVTLLFVAVYLVCYVVVAGNQYRRLRPYTEPLRCRSTRDHYHTHDSHCYRRPGCQVDSRNEALGIAMFTGLLGPLGIIGLGLMRIVKMFDRPVPEELAAKKAREQGNRDKSIASNENYLGMS
jgi:hypothetical protein